MWDALGVSSTGRTDRSVPTIPRGSTLVSLMTTISVARLMLLTWKPWHCPIFRQRGYNGHDSGLSR
jgi:hypothetical protein